MNKNYSYSEVLQIFADNVEKSFFMFNAYKIILDDGMILSYNMYTSNMYIVIEDSEQSSVLKFDNNIFFMYDTNIISYMYDNEYGECVGIQVPEDREGWFTFAMLHDCTMRDYENFKTMMKHFQKCST